MSLLKKENKSDFEIVAEYFANKSVCDEDDNCEEDGLAADVEDKEFSEPILIKTIMQELYNVTNEFDLNQTSTDSRAGITAYFTANLFMKEYDRYEINTFCDIMRNEYIPGKLNIQQCYDKYIKTRCSVARGNSPDQKTDHKLRDDNKNDITNVVNKSLLVVKNQLLEIDQVKEVVERLVQHKLSPIHGRQILFEGVNTKGRKFILFTPKSRYYPRYGTWWIDFNKTQYDIVNKYEEGLFVFRLENSKFCCFLWSEISEFINEKCKIIDPKSGELWRLYIYTSYIKIWNNDKVFRINVKNTDDLVSTVNSKLFMK